FHASSRKGDRHIAVRLNDLDATRATEATAIATSLMIGRGIQDRRGAGARKPAQVAGVSAAAQSPTSRQNKGHHAPGGERIEQFARNCLLVSLDDRFCYAQLAYPTKDAKRLTFGRYTPDHRDDFHQWEEDQLEGMKLDLVLSPADG